MDIVGTFQMGKTFTADGNMIVSNQTFFSLFPQKPEEGTDIGIISIKPGYSVHEIQQKLKALLSQNLKIMTKDEYILDETAYWNNVTPIGYIFNFGVTMGLFVGLVIVYLVLFNDITNHLHEYATLKAMGYGNSYFVRVVLSSATILTVLGFIPGLLICSFLYKSVEQSIFIKMDLTLAKAMLTLGLIGGMCFLSALMAVRKLKSANPVDVF